MHLEHHCKDSVTNQLKTQCCLVHEATTKAVRQRQLSFFLLANENDMALRLGQKAKLSAALTHRQHTSTGTLPETAWGQEPGKGGCPAEPEAWRCPCAGRATQDPASSLQSAAHQDPFLRKTVWGEERNSAPGAREAPAANCLPLLLRGRRW